MMNKELKEALHLRLVCGSDWVLLNKSWSCAIYIDKVTGIKLHIEGLQYPLKVGDTTEITLGSFEGVKLEEDSVKLFIDSLNAWEEEQINLKQHNLMLEQYRALGVVYKDG
jgi:hypothetical protein